MQLHRLFAASGVLVVVASLLVAACGSDDVPTAGCTISAASYDASCSADADCVGVPDGNLCNAACTNCATAAVNQASYTQYSEDLGNLHVDRRDCPCPNVPVKCVSGKCTVGGS